MRIQEDHVLVNVSAEMVSPEVANDIIYAVKKEYPEAAKVQVDYSAY